MREDPGGGQVRGVGLSTGKPWGAHLWREAEAGGWEALGNNEIRAGKWRGGTVSEEREAGKPLPLMSLFCSRFAEGLETEKAR